MYITYAWRLLKFKSTLSTLLYVILWIIALQLHATCCYFTCSYFVKIESFNDLLPVLGKRVYEEMKRLLKKTIKIKSNMSHTNILSLISLCTYKAKEWRWCIKQNKQEINFSSFFGNKIEIFFTSICYGLFIEQ